MFFVCLFVDVTPTVHWVAVKLHQFESNRHDLKKKKRKEEVKVNRI